MWFKKRRFCGDDIVRVDIINRYNYVLEISYDGSHYFGSQYQPNKITVESDLKKHLIFFFKDIENLGIPHQIKKDVREFFNCPK